MKKHSILFVSHEASLTGAPLVAYRLVDYLSKELNVAMVYLKNGNLLERHRHNFSIIQFSKKYPSIFLRIFQRIFRMRFAHRYDGLKEIEGFNPDLVFINSIASLPFLNQLGLQFKCKVLYVHEMPFAIKRYFSGMNYDISLFVKLGFEKIFVVNNVIMDFLINDCNVPASKIEVLLPSIDDNFFVKDDNSIQQTIKYEILFSGQAGWTKGVDLIPILASHLNKLGKGQTIRLGWLGDIDEITIQQINYEMKLGTIHNVTVDFLGVCYDVKSIINSCKIFISLARADAMPTASIEAMAQGKPIICFKGTGGMEELAKNAGYILEYPNLEGIANCVLQLLADEGIYKEYTNNALATAKRFSSDELGLQCLNSLQSILKNGN